MYTKVKMPDLVNPLTSTSFVHALISLRRGGANLENVRLLLKGVFENYKGEIIGQLPPPDTEINSNRVIELEVGSQSMVDHLPPSLFFDPRKEYRDFDKMELRSRNLFSCFDSMMAKIKATLEYILLVYDSVFLEHSFSKKFLGAFGLPEEGWTSEELFFWTALLPGFHQWAGTKKGTEEVLSKFLGIKIRIEENKRGENGLPIELRSLLGRKSSKLGLDWSLGNCFSECESSFEVVVGPISASEVGDFLPPGLKRKKLDQVLNHCVPGQLRWSVTLKLKQKEKIFCLGENTQNCVLGYSTYLNN